MKTMKKSMKILLIVSIVVTLFGASGLITVSSRKIDDSQVRLCQSYKEMWETVILVTEGVWQLTDAEREKWPQIDQLVQEAKTSPKALEDIRNKYLPDAKKAWQEAENERSRERNANQAGMTNGYCILTGGILLFGIWVLKFRKTKKNGQKTAVPGKTGMIVKQADEPAAEPEESIPAPKSTGVQEMIERLKTLSELRDAGILTEEEFLNKKAEFLAAL